MDIMQLAIMIMVVFAAGFIQGAIGFGSALLAVPILSLFMPIKTVVPFTVLNGLLVTAALCWHLRCDLRRELILPLVCGCVPGVAVGTVILSRAPADVLQLLLGIFVLLYVIYALAARGERLRRPSSSLGFVAGFGTGAIGAAFSAGGPPTIIYLSALDRSAVEIKATFAGFFFITGIMIALSHLGAGLMTAGVLYLFAVSAPAVFCGVHFGERLSRRVDDRRYRRLVIGFLLFMGVVLIFRSI